MVHILPVHASRGTARCRVPLGVKVGLRGGPQPLLHETTRREADFYNHLS